MAHCFGAGEPFLHEGEANTNILPLRMHHEGAKQQGRSSGIADNKRPETDGTCQSNVRIAHCQRQSLGWRASLTQTVRGLHAPVDAKGDIEQLLDEGLVGCFRIFNGK